MVLTPRLSNRMASTKTCALGTNVTGSVVLLFRLACSNVEAKLASAIALNK